MIRRVFVVLAIVTATMVAVPSLAFAVGESEMTKAECVEQEEAAYSSLSGAAPVCEQRYPIPTVWRTKLVAGEIGKGSVEVALEVTLGLTALIAAAILIPVGVKLIRRFT